MTVVYIASPYTQGDTGRNVCRQIDAAHKLIDHGFCPVAPLLSHYLHIHRQRRYGVWTKIDFEMVRRSDVVLRLRGKSKGADEEVRLAKSLGIPVVYSINKLLNLKFSQKRISTHAKIQ